MSSWKTLSRQIVYHHSKYLTVENHIVQLPDGRVFTDWNWMATPDYVNVAALTEDGRWICFRQGKYGIDGLALAAVGGYLEAGEDPLDAAQRELREESGYVSDDWTFLGSYRVDASHGAGTGYFYLARNARFEAKIASDDLEEQELLLLTHAEVEAGLRAGDFKVMAWAAIMALALLWNTN
ncbi:MAG: NUDIX hydrolase [Chloroflexota bacterium]